MCSGVVPQQPPKMLTNPSAANSCTKRLVTAVQADRQRLRVAHAVPESRHRLPRQNPPRSVGDGAADDQRQAHVQLFKHLFHRKQRRLGVERVKNRLHQNHVCAAFDQRLGLFVIGLAQLLKSDVARAGVVDIGADAGGFGRRAERRFISRAKSAIL